MKTWDDNRRAINELWPLNELTGEQRKLWTEDLSGLDQSVLYDAIRNVRRNNDSNYPQLKWIRDEYRVLKRLVDFRSAKSLRNDEPRVVVDIDDASDARMRDELLVVIDIATPSQFEETRDLIADKAACLQIKMATAFRLVTYMLNRLGLARGGRVGDAA